jgi:uncharacterized protein YutE (UPF0331/DUF86 family)
MLRCIGRIESRIPWTRLYFINDIDAQDVVPLNLTRIIQLSVDIAMHISANTNSHAPQTIPESFTTLNVLNAINKTTTTKLKKSVGFRKIAVHNYGELDLNLTFYIARNHIKEFKVPYRGL